MPEVDQLERGHGALDGEDGDLGRALDGANSEHGLLDAHDESHALLMEYSAGFAAFKLSGGENQSRI